MRLPTRALLSPWRWRTGEENDFWRSEFKLNTLMGKRFDSSGKHQAHEHYMKLMQTQIQGQVLQDSLRARDIKRVFMTSKASP